MSRAPSAGKRGASFDNQQQDAEKQNQSKREILSTHD